jgi:hypothetical protein
MKRHALVSIVTALTLGWAGSAAADLHFGLGMAPSAKGKPVDGLVFEETSYLTAWLGRLRQRPLGLGWYVGGGLTPHSVDGGRYSERHYSYGILNGGTTLGLGGSLVAYAGLGYSIEAAEERRQGRLERTPSGHDALNLNAGLLYRFSYSWAGNIGFDSAAEAISFGVTRRL